MITHSALIERWWGEATDQPRRALFIGAGFAKSAAPWSPLFNDYREPLYELLHRDGCEWADLPVELAKEKWWWSSLSVTDLIERVDRRMGREKLARVILAEPMTKPTILPARDAIARPVPDGMPQTYPTLKQWASIVTTSRALHLEPLLPQSGVNVLGRLIAEGVVDDLLSTNWDALIELGCMLAGLRVEDADEPAGPRGEWHSLLPHRIRVFETQDELVARWPVHGEMALFKLHGGVRTLNRLLAQGPTEAQDEDLRRSFFLSATDLSRWEGATQWVDERVSATLRSCATLFLGVSGADPVTFHGVRKQIAAWEETAAHQRRRDAAVWPFRTVAVDFGADLRLRNMLTIYLPDGRLDEPVCMGSVPIVLHGAHARRMLAWMEEDCAADQRADVRELHRLVCGALDACDRHSSAPPVVLLLSMSLAWGARHAASALAVGPFEVVHPSSAPFRRWWHAPWRDAPREARRRCLRAALPVLLRLARRDGLQVDPSTGIVTLPSAPAGGSAEENLLLLPCPWQVDFEWRDPRLAGVLRDRPFVWDESEAKVPLAGLKVLPLGGGEAPTGGLCVMSREVMWTKKEEINA
jgi:hypothetical protein